MNLRDRTVTTALVLACAFSTLGCSLLFTNGPDTEAPPSAAKEPRDCSTSRIPPIADTTLATFQAVRTGLAIGASDSVYDDSPMSREVDIGLGIGLVAAYAGSAIYGFYNTAACDDAQKKVTARRPVRLERTRAPVETPRE
jgi:hypothetical protein